MADHECERCHECDSCPACAADALDREVTETERLRLALATATREAEFQTRARHAAERATEAHAEALATATKEAELLRERLDQFDAYGMPNVASALDRIANAEAERDAAVARLEEQGRKVRVAIGRANGRWCEWGERAEMVLAMLEEAIEPPPLAPQKGAPE